MRNIVLMTFVTCALYCGTSSAVSDSASGVGDAQQSDKGEVGAVEYKSNIKSRVFGDVEFYYSRANNDVNFRVGKYSREDFLSTDYSIGANAEIWHKNNVVIGANVLMQAAREREYKVNVDMVTNTTSTSAASTIPVTKGNLNMSGYLVSNAGTTAISAKTATPNVDVNLGTTYVVKDKSVTISGATGTLDDATITVTGKDTVTPSDIANALQVTSTPATNPLTYSSSGSAQDLNLASVDITGSIPFSGTGNNSISGGTVTIKSAQLKEANVYVETVYGRVEAGKMSGPEDKFIIGANSIARGSGGIDGHWTEYANAGMRDTKNVHSELVSGGHFHTLPALFSEFSMDKPPKIAFYSPMGGKVQFGVAYTLDSGDDSPLQKFSAEFGDNDYRNIVSGGILFDGYFKDYGFNIALVGEYGKHEKSCDLNGDCTQNYHDLFSMSVGTSVAFGNLKLAGSYGYLGKSGKKKNLEKVSNYKLSEQSVMPRLPANLSNEWILSRSCVDAKGAHAECKYDGKDVVIYKSGQIDPYLSEIKSAIYNANDASDIGKYDTYYMTAGAAIDVGAAGFSVTYMRSYTGQDDIVGGRTKLDNLVFSMDYSLATGFKPYVEFSYFKLKDTAYMVLDESKITKAVLGATCSDGKGGVEQCDATHLKDLALVSDLGGKVYDAGSLPSLENKGFVIMGGFKVTF